MHATSIVMDAEASSLMLLDEATGELNVSIPTGPVQEEIVGLSIPKDKGIAGWVLKNNNPYISNDITQSDLFWKDLSEDFETRNIICVPLENETGEAFGVLQALNRNNGKDFEVSDVFVFETLAEHVAVAIERAQRYDKLVHKLDEKTVQLSEVHHRLKNNLATISALIELEMDKVEDDSMRELLNTTNSRIKSVANVHSMLYDTEQSGVIDLKLYLGSVIKNVSKIYQDGSKEIRLKYKIVDMKLDVSRAVLCGLILNELTVNAFKHAFDDRTTGKIDIEVDNIANEELVIRVKDDGVGIQKKGKGISSLFIVNALSRKLKAKVEADEARVSGFCIQVGFKL